MHFCESRLAYTVTLDVLPHARATAYTLLVRSRIILLLFSCVRQYQSAICECKKERHTNAGGLGFGVKDARREAQTTPTPNPGPNCTPFVAPNGSHKYIYIFDPAHPQSASRTRSVRRLAACALYTLSPKASAL